MKTCLIDTGPFVAYLNQQDPFHQSVATFVDQFKGGLATTCAVIGEVMYFIADHPNGPVAFAKFLIASRVQIVESTQAESVLTAAVLMDKYSDTPMDFADASLVILADRMGVFDVLTLDRRGFSTYRSEKGKSFRLALNP